MCTAIRWLCSMYVQCTFVCMYHTCVSIDFEFVLDTLCVSVRYLVPHPIVRVGTIVVNSGNLHDWGTSLFVFKNISRLNIGKNGWLIVFIFDINCQLGFGYQIGTVSYLQSQSVAIDFFVLQCFDKINVNRGGVNRILFSTKCTIWKIRKKIIVIIKYLSYSIRNEIIFWFLP